MKQDTPGKKMFIIAESLGALFTLSFLIQYPFAVKGAVLMSPALQDNLPFSLWQRALIGLCAFVRPTTYFPTPFQATMFTRDEARARAIESDPNEVRVATAKSFFEILKGMILVKLNAKKIQTPLLIQQASVDHLVSAKATEQFYNRLTVPDKFFILYKGFYHALYLDQGREQVFQDLLHWLEKRT